MSGYSGPMVANAFHTGATCPFCQETISEGQAVVKCDACGSLHHDLCWGHNQGCASYHCDQKVRQEHPQGADLVVTVGDLQRIVVPPKPVRKGAAEAARMFLPQGPRKLSVLAVVSLALAGLSLLGMAALWLLGLRDLEGVGSLAVPLMVALCLATMVTGIIALVVINTGGKVHGMAYASTAVVVASVLVVATIASLDRSLRATFRGNRINLRMNESRPLEADLQRMPPAQARAMRANVVLTCTDGGLFTGDLKYGSGVVVRMENHQAWILTNRHVIGAGEDADLSEVSSSIEVLFYNGETSKATVVWLPTGDVDLAVITCPALTPEKIQAVPLAVQAAEQGQKVFAVGNPEGLSWTYTEGVVSSIRTRQQAGRDIEIYQTQTPINSGNSGGGLYAAGGELVGINTWTHDKSQAEGLSFAISSRAIRDLLGGEDRRRFLGPEAEVPVPAEAAPLPAESPGGDSR